MKTKWKFVISFLFIGNASFLFGHGFNYDTKITGFTVGSDCIWNSKTYGLSPDINITLLIFNFAASSNLIKDKSPSNNVYFGVGLINFLQLQFGTNFSDKRLRVRTILPIFSKLSFTWRNDPIEWFERINLQLHYEKNYTNTELTNFGIGVSILLYSL